MAIISRIDCGTPNLSKKKKSYESQAGEAPWSRKLYLPGNILEQFFNLWYNWQVVVVSWVICSERQTKTTFNLK
jgi:hypothetical protein